MSKQIEEVMGLVIAMSDADFNAGVLTGRSDYAGAASQEAESSRLERAIESKLRELLPVWQSIETVPPDQWLLVAYADKEVSKAILIDGQWNDWDGDFYGIPTHWMQLAKAPE